MSGFSPNQSFNRSFVLDKSLSLNKNRRDVRSSILWGCLNVLILIILLYDIAYSCPVQYDIYDYVKSILLLIVFTNIVYHVTKVTISNFNKEQIPITLEQKKLLGISDADPNYKIVDPMNTSIVQTPSKSFSQSPASNSSLPLSSTPMNITAGSSWRSLSSNESLNYSLPSPSWTYRQVTPMSSYFSENPVSNVEFRTSPETGTISSEDDLNKYLQDFANTSKKKLHTQGQPSLILNKLSSLWKSSGYQIATQSPTPNRSPTTKLEHGLSPTRTDISALANWSRINVDIVTLTRWNENLRRWLSETILERLVAEFDRIDESFEKHGLGDIKIGSVGLERLRKTAQLSHIRQSMPHLSTLIPFLEVSPNQEYVVKRIRELARGGCISDYRWNGGSSYNGKEWDESLPTDSAILMHLLASYLDTQLVPLPNNPDTKPFSGIYYVKHKDKPTSRNLLIQQVSEKPSHYQVVLGGTQYEMVQGYNNLFHSILFFLYHVHKQEHGMLARVNLGSAGVNMLWIIGEELQ